jgi:hypothetical protein
MTLAPIDRRGLIKICAITLEGIGQKPSFRNIRETISLLRRGLLYLDTWCDEDGRQLCQIKVTPSVVDCLEKRVLH